MQRDLFEIFIKKRESVAGFPGTWYKRDRNHNERGFLSCLKILLCSSPSRWAL
jgi:hypothetical protein